MEDDPEQMPCLIIPPDHPLAEKLFDSVTDEEAYAVIDAYREEVGGRPGQKVGMTYAKRAGHPGLWAVVTSRPWPMAH